MNELRDGVPPDGAVKSDLFTQLAHASWTLRRCRRAERSDHRTLKGLQALQTARQFAGETKTLPLAEPRKLQKHRTLPAQSEVARRDAEMIRAFEAFIAPPLPRIEHSNPIPAIHCAP